VFSGYFGQRLALIPLTLIGITIIVFVLARVMPGDPAQLAAGEQATPEMVETFRKEYRLDRPLHEQYGAYLWGLLHGDLGRSMFTGRPVRDDLRVFLPATLELTAVGIGIALVVGVPAGVLSALYRNRWPDQIARSLALTGVSFPVFWLAMMLQLVLSVAVDLLPIGGRFPAAFKGPPSVTGFYTIDFALAADLEGVVITLSHLFMPAFCLAVGSIASITRITRTSVLDVLNRDFIRTVRAMGVPERRVIGKYVLRNAFIATLTMIGVALTYMLAGSVLVESVFDWPGIGLYAFKSIVQLDFQPIAAFTVIVGVMVALVNLAIDMLYAVVDPRIRHEAKR
jgi:peptide/nickel transport system permease protein